MTPRPSLIGRLSHSRLLGNDLWRRTIFIVLIAIFGFLALFPRHYRAVVSLTPADPASLGLSGTLSQLGAGSSIFGSQIAIDVSVKIARSLYVRDTVSRQLDLPKRLHMTNLQAVRWLEHSVYVQTLRGGIVQIETRNRDPDFGLKIVAAYSDAVRNQLGIISRGQTDYKRKVLEKLVAQSRDRLTRAQAAYNDFRRQTKYGDPQSALATVASRVPSLEAQIIAKRGEINTLSHFATGNNLQVRKAEADLVELQRQLTEAKSEQAGQQGSVEQVVQQTTKEQKLERELNISRELYYSYERYLQGTIVEYLTSTANIRILEPAYIDPDRQFNIAPLALAVLILLIGLAIEFYRLRPPVGDGAID